MTIKVEFEELQYVNRAANSDKFYRLFTWDDTVAIQYGRTGTFGTFTRKVCSSPTTASSLYLKKRQEKIAKGYNSTKARQITFGDTPNDGQLDSAARGMQGDPIPPREVATATRDKAVAGMLAILQETDDDPDPKVYEAVVAHLSSLYEVSKYALESVSPLRPMLADTMVKSDLEKHLTTDSWIAQRKLDGERFIIEVDEGRVAVYNRQGQPKVANLTPDLLVPFQNLSASYWVFDGELVGRCLSLFDMPAAGGFLSHNATFAERYEVLADTLIGMGLADSKEITLLSNHVGTEAKRLLLKQSMEDQREGIMFRKVSSRYQFGGRSKELLKHKFVKEADVFVTRVNVKNKENAEFAVYRDADPVVVGQASTIGKGDIKVGDVLEVKFLYVLDPENPRMFQPRIMRKRTDKSATECSIAQFSQAGTNKEI